MRCGLKFALVGLWSCLIWAQAEIGLLVGDGREIGNQLTGTAIYASASEAGPYRLIQLDGPLDRARQQALQASGADLLFAIPKWAYLVRIPANWRPPACVAFQGLFHPGMKIHPDIDAQNDQDLIIRLYPGGDLRGVEQELSNWGGVIKGRVEFEGLIKVQVHFDQGLPLLLIGRLKDVVWIESVVPTLLRNDRTRWIVQSYDDPAHVTYTTPIYDHNLRGQGEIIGIIDSPIQVLSCFFYDSVPIGPTHRKIVYYFGSQAAQAHGTHVAGSAVGFRSTGSIAGAGLAYLAKMAFTDINTININLPFINFAIHRDQGAFVQSNSWGNSGTSYASMSEDVDTFSYLYEDQLLVFACANAFLWPLPSVQVPENALNALAVGATEAHVNLAHLRSEYHGSCTKGPTPLDGRRKPEIFAPGYHTLSADSQAGCGLRQMGGTSMATPIVSAGAALVRQYFRNGFYPQGSPSPSRSFVPSGALLKAVLINGTVNMRYDTELSPTSFVDTPVPNDIEGWGRLNLDHSLSFLGETEQLRVVDIRNANGLETNDVYAFEVDLIAGTPFRATLAFTAPPGFSGATSVISNDLNLVVSGPSGIFVGNNWVNGASAPGGLPDPLNNLESILIKQPLSGTYLIRVEAPEINLGPQGFALALTGHFNESGDSLEIEDQTLPCFGDSIQLVPQIHSDCPPSQFEWSPSEGLSDPNRFNPIANPEVTTTYTLTARDAGGTCVAESSCTVFVPEVTATITMPPEIECWGGATTLEAVPTSCFLGNSHWSPTTGLTDPDAFTTQATPLSSTTYTFQIESPGGDTLFEASVWVQVPLMDLNNDMILDSQDFALLQAIWGFQSSQPSWPPIQDADYNHNQRIDILDLLHFQTCLP
ncbi:MAG: S8 family serine peptidase [Acidobacteria bacterium]|nr:S8 family serine peptidase [Acidobacteriota bacterium]